MTENLPTNPNLEILELALSELDTLADEFVFIGGCATGLLITDLAAPPIRQTIDVDAIVELGSLNDYYQLSKQLRAKGFNEDRSPDAPICRWRKGLLMLDIMPTDEKILQFGNPWYAQAWEMASSIHLPSGRSLRLISAPHFLVTKLLAFEGRGEGDFQLSHDIEDMIAVVDGRPELVEEVQAAPSDLQACIQDAFSRQLDNTAFMRSIPGHLPADEASQGRLPILIDRIEKLAGQR